jgi:hypothetical protein
LSVPHMYLAVVQWKSYMMSAILRDTWKRCKVSNEHPVLIDDFLIMYWDWCWCNIRWWGSTDQTHGAHRRGWHTLGDSACNSEPWNQRYFQLCGLCKK